MLSRFARLGRWARGSVDEAPRSAPRTTGPGPEGGPPSGDAWADESTPVPEQPIPLPPVVVDRRARIGELVPTRRPRSLLPAISLPVPRVPKRAIFAVGICAGLAAPAVTRGLAARALMATLGPGRAAPSTAAGPLEAATVEIVRVTFGSAQRGQVAELVGKLLEQIRR